MHKYLFEIENNKRVYYSVRGESIPIYEVINSNQSKQIVNDILSNEILKITPIKEDVIKITLSNFNELTVSKTFLKFPDQNMEIKALISKILAYINGLEKESLETLAQKYNGYVPTINRTKSKNHKKMIVAATLAGSIFLSGLGVSLAKKNNKEEKIDIPLSDILIDDNEVNISNTLASNVQAEDLIYEPEAPLDSSSHENNTPTEESNTNNENNTISLDKTISTPEITYNFDYVFSDISENGKLEITKEYFGDLIEYYCNRWGLPPELCLAQLSQERPKVVNGECKNPFQITAKYFVGETFTIPVYDSNGFTGSYDKFTVTEASLNTFEGNIMAGLAYLRKCINRTDSLFTGLYLYNQGEPSLSAACNYYGLDINDYKGDINALNACDLITKYHQELYGSSYGDYDYLANVFRYIPTSDRGSVMLSYYLGEEKINIALNNTREYNSELTR